MADVTITGLPNAATLTGAERVPMDQAGTTVDASAQAIANLATAATIGLGSVNNTSDLNKPVSTATQTALDGKAAASHTQAASTITGLAAVATTGVYTDLSGRPTLATVATTGGYGDLISKPTLGTAAPLDVAATGDASATQVVKGNDSRLSDARTPAAHNQAASTITGLATVATTGSASDLGSGTLPAARLPATAVTAGAYGSSTLVPVITIDTAGRITAASTVAVSGGGGGGSGTVTSVGLNLPSLFSVSGSPVTTTGTLTATLAAQSANLVLAGPTTGSSAPTFRALVAGDLPATAVSAGSYTYIASLTVDAAGRITAASSGTAPLSVGTTTGTVAAGDDTRITGALSTATAASTYQPLTANLSSLGTQAPSYYLSRANHTGTQAASTVSMATSRILGRTTAGSGAAEEITVGTGLSLTAGTLTATGGGGGGTPGGLATEVQFNSAGVFGGISTLKYDGSILTTNGRFINSYNATASSPAKAFTGTWFTGGTATTTKPQVLIEPTGATSTAWSTAGTALGVNASSGFAGNLLDLQVNGSTVVSVNGSTRRLNLGAFAYLSWDADGYTPTITNRYGGAFTFRDSLQIPNSSFLAGSGISNRYYVSATRSTISPALNTDTPTATGWIVGKMGGGYPASSGLHNGAGQAIWCGNGAQPTDVNANGGNAGNFDVWLNAGGAGKGTGVAGANGKLRVVDDSTDAEVFSVEQTGIVQIGGARTVANLPASPAVGMITRVTDATAPAMGTTVAGGGAAAALCWYNGANWSVIGV